MNSAFGSLAAISRTIRNGYTVKSSFLLSFLESVPEVSAKLKGTNTKDRKFKDAVNAVEQAAMLFLVEMK